MKTKMPHLMTMITLPMMTPSRVSQESGEMEDYDEVFHLQLKLANEKTDTADFSVRPSSTLLRGSTFPTFSLLALLGDGRTLRVFSRESLAADYTVLLFLPNPIERRLDTAELATLRKQVQRRRNRRGS